VDFRAEVTDDHRPTVDAWLSAEFIAWVLRDLYRGDMAVFASFWSPPPYLNYPGQMLTFEIHGWRPSAEPEEVAAQLKAFRRGQYVGARAVHLYCESDQTAHPASDPVVGNDWPRTTLHGPVRTPGLTRSA